jgi:GTP-binding protein Era
VRTGFVSVVGRPNVGKSTLVNRLVGTKVSITSSRPNTTRHRVRGVVHLEDAQIVLVDTPGLHRPKTALGLRLNETATGSFDDVDGIIAVVDATGPIGPGDRLVLGRSVEALRRADRGGDRAPLLVVAVNKIDRARGEQVLQQLATAADVVNEIVAADSRGAPDVEYVPVSATRETGLDELVALVADRLPEGPTYYPTDMVTDLPDEVRVAELVREQLLVRAREELPHSIACRVTEWDWPRIRCEIVVERESQKAMVIGKGGEVLKAVGTAARAQLPEGAYLELFVRVEKHWQQREDLIDRLGY